MKKVFFIACVAIVQVATAQNSLELRAYTSDGITKNILYLNGQPFDGSRSSLLAKEVSKPKQPINTRYAVLHKDVPRGTSQFRDPYTIFVKDENGLWEETITVFNTIPTIVDSGGDILVTVHGGGNDQEGTSILRPFIQKTKKRWLLVKE
jgi:hypothetical protein